MKTEEKQRTRAINLTIPAELIRSAKDLGINVSNAATAGLAEAVKRRQEEEWLKNNAAALQAYNDRIDREGLPLQAYWIGNHGTI